jgi:hypothetical protein
VKRGIFLQQDNERELILNPPHKPHTAITIYPSNVNIQLEKIMISKNGKRLKIKCKIPVKTTGAVNAILVIATPRGIVSQHFQIKPN